MERNEEIRRLYEEALGALIEKVKRDHWILAAVLLGSLSHDVVWEKSDIDLLLVTQEGRQKRAGLTLVERGVIIHAFLASRSEFRRILEGSIQSSFEHSLLTTGRLIYTHDETIAEIFEGRRTLGARDQEIQLLRRGTGILPALVKAEKWFHVKHDLNYSFFWIMRVIDGLAAIEVILNGEITGREVIQQALRYNPAFFHAVYTDLINGPKTEDTIGGALSAINGYLHERLAVIFKPLFDYLSEVEGVRSATELNHYFSNQMNLEGVDMACEWLADQEIIQKLSAPVRLTEKSRVDVEEAAYYYSG
jgi:hypothetical protein